MCIRDRGAVTQGEGPGAYTEWQVSDRSVGGMMKKPMPMPSFWGVYIAVEDINAAAKKLEELGGGIIQPPTEIEPGIFAVVTDPVGSMFNIFQQKS